MSTVTMDHIRELLAIVYECEPVCVLACELGMPFSSLGDLKRDVITDPADHDYHMHGAIVSREPGWVKRLVQNTTVIPTGQHLLFAAENGFFGACEVLINAGARMIQHQSDRWPWWVRHTEQRIARVQERVNDAVSVLWFGLDFPPEILTMIVGHVWATRFDLASWNGERNWNVQTAHAMDVLNIV
jgi:hypothetical protein